MAISPYRRCPRRRHGWAAVASSILFALAACATPIEAFSAARDEPTTPAPPARDDKPRFENGLEEALRASPRSRFTVLIDLTEQVDLDQLAASFDRATVGSKPARRRAVIRALERVAQQQQARLQPEIDRLLAEGAIARVTPVAIVNRVVVDGSGAGILALASSVEVAHVLAEWRSESESGRDDGGARSSSPASDTIESWALRSLGIDRLWREGLRGRGVIVASIDTGVFEGHEQLRGRRLDGDRGWFDPVNGSTAPSDAHGHGTSVMSIAVGSNPDGRVVGVAPEARWASALGNWHNHYSRVRMTLAADWILRRAQPDVLVNAWSHDEGMCTDFDLPFIRAWKAAEIFVVFPAGNAGPGTATGESPAQIAGAFPDNAPVFSVAASARTGGLLGISSRGPSRCGSPVFPTVTAPGEDLPYAITANPRGYALGRGTSLSAALIAGGAALLLEAVPEASPEQLERALAGSTRRSVGRTNDDAPGTVDLFAALNRLRRDVREASGASPR